MGCNIELESITSAIKARDLLKKNKFGAKIEKSTSGSKKGCAYSVIVDKNCSIALPILEKNGIRILGIS
ncbi:MAG: DUF3343 domain-containing protein [Clostridia bacterium]|nr:DUF3343 domain-containing protein [Clostridia bacterium]